MKTLTRALAVTGVTGLLMLTPAHAYAQAGTSLWEMEEIVMIIIGLPMIIMFSYVLPRTYYLTRQ